MPEELIPTETPAIPEKKKREPKKKKPGPKKGSKRGPYKRNAKKKAAKKKKSPILAEKSSIRMLHYNLDGEDMTQEVDEGDIEAMVMETFAEKKDVQEIYVLKPCTVFKRPIIESIDL